MEELVHLIAKTYGIVGLLILSPMVAAVYLWRDNVRLNTKVADMAEAHAKSVDDLGQRVVGAQEKRVADSQGVTEKLVEMIGDHTSAQKETNTALDRIGDMVSMLLGSQAQECRHEPSRVVEEPEDPESGRGRAAPSRRGQGLRRGGSGSSS